MSPLLAIAFFAAVAICFEPACTGQAASKTDGKSKPPVADNSSPEKTALSYMAIKNYYDMLSMAYRMDSSKTYLESMKAELPLHRDEAKKYQEKRIKSLENRIKFEEKNAAQLSKSRITHLSTIDTNDSNIKIVTFKIERADIRMKKKEKDDDPDEWELEETITYYYMVVRNETKSWKMDYFKFCDNPDILDSMIKYAKEGIK